MAAEFRTRDLHNLPFVTVLVIAVCGLVYGPIRSEHWLRGVGVIAVAMFLAAAFRAVLSDSQAGMLRVRRRTFDAFCYMLLGVGILVIGFALPPR